MASYKYMLWLRFFWDILGLIPRISNAYCFGLFINFYLKTNNNELAWKRYLLPGHHVVLGG
jgi:hypothetical protein